MPVCPRVVLAVSNLLMLSLLAVPLMICYARADSGHALVLLPGKSIADRLAIEPAPAKPFQA